MNKKVGVKRYFFCVISRYRPKYEIGGSHDMESNKLPFCLGFC